MSLIPVFLSLLSLLIPQDSAEIVFAGDAMQHQRQIDAAMQPDGSLDYSPYFESLRPYISSADFAVVNLRHLSVALPIRAIRCFAPTTTMSTR